MDSGGASGGGDCHGSAGRDRQERLVSRTRCLSGRATQMAEQCDHGTGRAGRAQSQPTGHPARQETDQGTRTRVVAQGPGTRRNRSSAGALEKVAAIFNKGEDE